MTRQRGASDASGGSGAARPARLQRGSAAQQILFPFACCAACDHVDKGEESFQQQQPQASRLLLSGDQQGQNSEDASAAPTVGGMGGLPTASSRDGEAQLQEFVKDFAKCAVRGQPCEVLDASSGEVAQVRYLLDPSLLKLTLLPRLAANGTASGMMKERQLQIANIAEIQSMDLPGDALAGCLSEAAASALNMGAARERALAILMDDGSPPLFLLEGSGVDRDRFVMCVKILRIYARAYDPAGTNPGP
eukprot:TRINITY_DN28263_c0_g2_i1.p2 TRINITY_DN28263_c0_g2~~TRINITY_DN28263_c0_g2_i1.p2  ORF type:complete len:249 (+),score=64.48 TRINITY_DN28263_c0_g2_i1:152-898(+)